MQKTRMKKSTLPFWVKEAAVTAVGLIVCGLIVAFLSSCAAGTGGAYDAWFYFPEDHTDQYQRQNAELYHDRNSSPANPAPSVPSVPTVPEVVHQDNGNHQGGGNNGNGQGNGGGNGTSNEGNGKGPK